MLDLRVLQKDGQQGRDLKYLETVLEGAVQLFFAQIPLAPPAYVVGIFAHSPSSAKRLVNKA